MADFNPNDPTIPIIGRGQPAPRIQKVPIANLVLNDPEGQAELRPQDDLTLVELYKLTLLLGWILGTPPMPQPDPQTQGRTAVVLALQWRQYIADEQLERHFEFRMRPDQETVGTA